ncbi:MAG: hypothetical protein HC836_37230 [Richelia sp. RM2_1_2]|nr:hypothetical protein [Richelia sp. RM2_1_2]
MNNSSLPTIVLSDGKPLDLNNFIEIMGYQIEHEITGRLLPTCSRHEIYTKKRMFEKFHELVTMGLISEKEVSDWRIIPISAIELEGVSGYVIV